MLHMILQNLFVLWKYSLKPLSSLMTKILTTTILATLLVTSLFLSSARAADDVTTLATPKIQHLVVIFQENVSFDHYFATYPVATNPAGEPASNPKKDTPSVNGLNGSLLSPNNPNSVQPFRL